MEALRIRQQMSRLIVAMPPRDQHSIDTAWFHQRVQESRHGSLRVLGEIMVNRLGCPMGISNLSRMLAGERTMTVSEARQLADLLGVSLRAVIEHSGVATRPADWRR